MNNDHAAPLTTSFRAYRPPGDPAPAPAQSAAPEARAAREAVIDTLAALTPVPHHWQKGDEIDPRYGELIDARMQNLTLAERVAMEMIMDTRREANTYTSDYDPLSYGAVRRADYDGDTRPMALQDNLGPLTPPRPVEVPPRSRNWYGGR